MKTITGSAGTTVSYSVAGSGPPLVLVHGGFSDHETNWSFVSPLFQRQFTVYAIARRGRGATDVTERHTLEDEARDVADVIRSIGVPVRLLGHSYGAHCALLAAAHLPDRIDKLVLYEPIWPHAIKPDALAALETLAAAGAWDQFAFAFFANTLHVPTQELEAVRAALHGEAALAAPLLRRIEGEMDAAPRAAGSVALDLRLELLRAHCGSPHGMKRTWPLRLSPSRRQSKKRQRKEKREAEGEVS